MGKENLRRRAKEGKEQEHTNNRTTRCARQKGERESVRAHERCFDVFFHFSPWSISFWAFGSSGQRPQFKGPTEKSSQSLQCATVLCVAQTPPKSREREREAKFYFKEKIKKLY